MPKYRGNDDDWLDAENEGKGASKSFHKKNKTKPEIGYLSPDATNALVIEVYPNRCKVRVDPSAEISVKPLHHGEFRLVDCNYRRAKIPSQQNNERAPVAVGDRVLVEEDSPGAFVVAGLGERKNAFSRPAPHTEKRHVLAANVDVLVVVASAEEPEFSPGLVDRFLVGAHKAHIAPLLIVNKEDLIKDGNPRIWEEYQQIGYPVYLISAKSGGQAQQKIDELREKLSTQVSVFCGTSGVGKTSLLRVLLKDPEFGRVNKLSESTGRGVHTTTVSSFVKGTNWVDTPGIRELGLWQVEASELREYFPEFTKLACHSKNCLHLPENHECEATDLFRYQSYLRMYESLNPREESEI